MSIGQPAPFPGQSDKIVQVENLSKKYGNNVAVNGVSFSLTKGEVFAFLGPNGAGKTTTVEILECLRNPTGGQALVLGYDVSRRSDQAEIRKRIGVLPQDFNAIDRLTVRENIDYFGAMYDHQLDADKLIELVDLKDKRDEQFKKLSGGLKQRVGLAVSLVNDPDVVFLDEPTTGLDPRARRDVWGVVERLKSQGKKTLIIREAGEEGLKQLPPGLPKAELRNAGDIAVPLNNGELTNILMSLGATPLHDKEIEVRRPTLDDVFLNLTGRRVSEEGN